MQHPLSFTMRCLILLAVLMALPQLAQAQQGGGAFQSQTQTYPFSAAASAGTAVQIAANSGGPTGYGQYLVANTGANGAWVTLAFSSALAAQTIPTGSTPGNAVWLPAGAACTYSGPSQAWFNAQTASSTTTLTVTGGTGTAGCVAQSGGGSGPAPTVTANQGTGAAAAGAWPMYQTNGAGTIIGTAANPTYVQVPSTNPLPATNSGAVDASNSTTATLLANATFTGTAVSVLPYTDIEVIVYSDQASAANGLLIEFSKDGTNWDDSSPATFTPGSAGPNQGQVFIAGVRSAFYRIVYTNGTTNQTTFRLTSVLKGLSVTSDILSINATLNANNHALVTSSQIFGLTTGGGGGYVPVKVNPSGTLTTADGADATPGSAAVGTSMQVAGSDGTNVRTVATDATGQVKVLPQPVSPPTASILSGRQSFGATTGATTLITITAGKTFTGIIASSVSCQNAAANATACQATAAFTTVGAGTTPAAGALFDCDARAGANAATGTVGSQAANFCSIPVNVACSTGTCTIAVASTNTGTSAVVTATASGTQQ